MLVTCSGTEFNLSDSTLANLTLKTDDLDRKPKTMAMCFQFAKGYALELDTLSRLKLLHLLADAKFLQMQELQDAVELALKGRLNYAIPSQSRPAEQRKERVEPRPEGSNDAPPEPIKTRCCVIRKERGVPQHDPDNRVCDATFSIPDCEPPCDYPQECPVEQQIPLMIPPLEMLQTILDPSVFVQRRRPMQHPQPIFHEEEPVPQVRTKRFQKLDEFINRY